MGFPPSAEQEVLGWLVKGHVPRGLKPQGSWVLSLGLLMWGSNMSDSILALSFVFFF